MADFTIRPGQTIWRHGRIWYPGQEGALQAAGFSDSHKAIKARNGTIDWHGQSGDSAGDDGADQVNASEGARALADEAGLDLAALVAEGSITGTGPGGRILKRDVKAYLDKEE